MRTIDEIKAEIQQEQNRIDNGFPFAKQVGLYHKEELECELRAALIDGIPLEAVEEWAEAWREGRAVVLPFVTTGDVGVTSGYYQCLDGSTIKISGKVCVIGATKESCERHDSKVAAQKEPNT